MSHPRIQNSSVADPDPVPFWPQGPGSQTHIFESLVTIFGVKSSIILRKLAHIFFFSTSKLYQFAILWNLWLHKMLWQLIFFHPSLLDPGNGMGKNQDPGSGINIPDPQHCKIRGLTAWSGWLPWQSRGEWFTLARPWRVIYLGKAVASDLPWQGRGEW
jgi:hypothetical protein